MCTKYEFFRGTAFFRVRQQVRNMRDSTNYGDGIGQNIYEISEFFFLKMPVIRARVVGFRGTRYEYEKNTKH